MNSRSTWRKSMLKSWLLAGLMLPASLSAQTDAIGSSTLWTDVSAAAAVASNKGAPATDWINPRNARLLKLGAYELDARLATAAQRGAGAENTNLILTLPKPEGGFERFRVWEDSVMAPQLAAWMAAQGFAMRTFAGTSLDRPGVGLRFDWGGPRGFHASVLGPQGGYYIDPRWRDDTEHYVAYAREQLSSRQQPFICLTESAEPDHSSSAFRPIAARNTSGARRIYRLALAATGEYTSFHGGTAVLGQAAIVTSVNRQNQIYLRDTSIFLQLVGNNQNIVYTNSLTDPYANNNGSAMLNQNQTNLTTAIGTANYDIGHVFSTGGGGIASLESPCAANNKARGVTGLPTPVGDAFDVDFVAHEMGHQFGAQHTFNSQIRNCAGGNRSAAAAYEPGSGSTIMGYAGICGADDLQPNSDAFFHFKSLEQILNFTEGNGSLSTLGNCSAKVAGINNNEPTVDAGPNYTIPARTPFELIALAGADADDSSNLSYLWEQYDLGAARSVAAGDGGSGPIIRSFPATGSPVRSVPRLSTVLGQTAAAKGEILPTTSRTLTFRVTLRDNDADGGRIGTDTMTLSAVDTGAAFAVTAPNGGETLQHTALVTWSIAGTNAGAINTSAVDIFFSADDGQSFVPVLLATPNDGSQQVSIPPGTSTTTARIKVRGSGNVFYDISNAAFSASAASATPGSLSINDVSVTEGNSGTVLATFTVIRSVSTAGTATVNYATANGSAKIANADYFASSGTVSFASGQTTRTLTVTVNGDTAVEANETFRVNLSGAVGATIADAQGVGRILNDDITQLRINDISVAEGNGSGTTARTFRVTRSGAVPSANVSVNYATADGTAVAGASPGGDYLATSGTLTLTPSQTSKTFTVPVNRDNLVEDNEFFSVNLSGAVGATVTDAQGIATLTNDD